MLERRDGTIVPVKVVLGIQRAIPQKLKHGAMILVGAAFGLQPDLGATTSAQIRRIGTRLHFEFAQAVDRGNVGNVNHVALDAHPIQGNFIAILTRTTRNDRALIVGQSGIVEGAQAVLRGAGDQRRQRIASRPLSARAARRLPYGRAQSCLG